MYPTGLKNISAFLSLFSLMFGGAGVLSNSLSGENAVDPSLNSTACQAVVSSASDGFCEEAGCDGGKVDCYAPPQGGMCFTSEDDSEDDEKEVTKQ